MLVMFPTNRVRELRKRAGMSQAELARLAGISQPAISQIENDTRPLSVDWMRTLARILDCQPADLLGDDDNPYRPSDEEQELLAMWRNADAAQRELIRRVAEPVSGFVAETPGTGHPVRRRAA